MLGKLIKLPTSPKTQHFTGHRNDLIDIYASLDVFLMTSVTEGMPNTLLEAMAMGLASVATKVGGIPELLPDGEGGFLAPAGDAQALAAHVIMLLQDGALRERLQQAARARIEGFFPLLVGFAKWKNIMYGLQAWHLIQCDNVGFFYSSML